MNRKMIIPLPESSTDAKSLVISSQASIEHFSLTQGTLATVGEGIFSIVRETRLKGCAPKILYLANILDTPNSAFHTVKMAAKRYLAWAISVSCLGGIDMLKTAVAAAKQAACEMPSSDKPMLVFGLAMLPTNDAAFASLFHSKDSLLDHICRQAEISQVAGLDGIILPIDAIRPICEYRQEGFQIIASDWNTRGTFDANNPAIIGADFELANEQDIVGPKDHQDLV